MTVMHETRADMNLDAYCTRYVLLNVLTGGNLEKCLLYDGHWTHYHIVLLINRCIQGQTLGLDKLSGGLIPGQYRFSLPWQPPSA